MEMNSIMTPCPYTVESSSTLDEVLQIMSQREIRHLPVVSPEGDLVGIISEREVRLALLVTSPTGSCPQVGEICSDNPFFVEDSASVESVTEQMAEQKKSCALVFDKEENVIGIFTITDALKMLSLLLKKEALEKNS